MGISAPRGVAGGVKIGSAIADVYGYIGTQDERHRHPEKSAIADVYKYIGTGFPDGSAGDRSATADVYEYIGTDTAQC